MPGRPLAKATGQIWRATQINLASRCYRGIEGLGDRTVSLGIAADPSKDRLIQVPHLGSQR